MYTIYLDGKPLYDPSREIEVIEPTLKREENAAGSLEFDIPHDHPLYDEISLMTSEITVYDDDKEIWSGRPVETNQDFYKVKSVYCEGELSYLADTIQPQSESHDIEVSAWLRMLLNNHNAKAPTVRRFQLGIVTVYGTLYRYTNYETTLQCIMEKLIDRLGGHLRIRKEGGVRYLDYLAEYPKAAQQEIVFGRNLLDYSTNFNYTDMATVIVPLGARQEESQYTALESYLTVESVNKGSIFVENADLVRTFGRITKVVKWDDVTVPQNLLSKAKAWLQTQQFADMQLQINAVDFHLIDKGVPSLDMLDEVHARSEPHGLSIWLPVTGMTLPIANPAGMTLTLGKTVNVSYTSKAIADNREILDSIVPASAILQQAKQNATDLIKTGALGSHVVVLPDELYVTDSANLDTAKRVWRFNLNGLGYSKNGRNGTFGLAMTMDGAIVADRITTGTLNATVIRAGTIRDVKNSNYWNLETGEFKLSASATVGGKTVSAIAQGAVDAQTQTTIFNKLTNNGQTQGIYLSGGKLYINASYIATGTLADKDRNTVFNLSTGTLTMKKGSININDAFKVSDKGVLTATGASITGTVKSTGNDAWIRLREGYAEGAANAYSTTSVNGWFGFNIYDTTTRRYGVGVAGRGDIALLSNAITVGSYVNPGGNPTVKEGYTGTISNLVRNLAQPVVSIRATWTDYTNVLRSDGTYYYRISVPTSISASASQSWNTASVEFTKGLAT